MVEATPLSLAGENTNEEETTTTAGHESSVTSNAAESVGVEAPIESNSPTITSSKAGPLMQKAAASRLNRQAYTSVPERNLENSMFELETSDLELLESRVAELEQYLGIENMDMQFFEENQGEDLNKKAQVLEDFLRVAEDKYFCINELFSKFEKMDTFWKHERPFVQQCEDLQQKTKFVTDWLNEL